MPHLLPLNSLFRRSRTKSDQACGALPIAGWFSVALLRGDSCGSPSLQRCRHHAWQKPSISPGGTSIPAACTGALNVPFLVADQQRGRPTLMDQQQRQGRQGDQRPADQQRHQRTGGRFGTPAGIPDPAQQSGLDGIQPAIPGWLGPLIEAINQMSPQQWSRYYDRPGCSPPDPPGSRMGPRLRC
jgi:hypothetical protein